MSNTWQRNAIGLTGGYGSGKSSVAKLLKGLGAYVIDADELARAVAAPGGAAYQEIVKHFGKKVLASDGQLDRKMLANIVFNSPAERAKLEAITHPRIRERAAELAEAALKAGERTIVYDCPLLFESGLDKAGFKKILLVAAPEATVIERVKQRNNLNEAQIKARLQAQLPMDEKRKRSDIIIENDSTFKALRMRVKQVYDKL